MPLGFAGKYFAAEKSVMPEQELGQLFGEKTATAKKK
jgi:hypothetical protein